MFKKWFFIVLSIIGLFAHDGAFAAKKKHKTSSTRKKVTVSVAHNKTNHHKSIKGSKSHYAKHSKKHAKKSRHGVSVNRAHDDIATTSSRVAPLALIASNQEKSRLNDSAHKLVFANSNKEDEGYFASVFSSQKKSASFQTLEGNAAIFKSVSGWDDKKFYVLTNELPVGTIVRVTTSDFKSICAKVISALPDVSANIKYRLNDAAAAILGITNKTFPISVTY